MGVGGSKSSSSAELLNQIAISATQSIISRCVTQATQQQLLSVKNVAGNVSMSGVSMSQGASVDVKCMMTAQVQSAIQNQIANDIAQYAQSQSEAFIGALGQSIAEAKVNIQNRLSLAVNQSTLQESFNAAIQDQQIEVANVGGNVIMKDISMAQSLQLTAETLINGTAYSTVINDIANAVDQTTDAKQTNPIAELIDSVGGIFSSWIGMVIAIATVGGVVMLVFVFMFFRSGVANTLGDAAADKIRQMDVSAMTKSMGGPGGMSMGR